MLFSNFLKYRCLFGAYSLREAAAGAEFAAGGRVQRAWNISLKNDVFYLGTRIWYWNGG